MKKLLPIIIFLSVLSGCVLFSEESAFDIYRIADKPKDFLNRYNAHLYAGALPDTLLKVKARTATAQGYITYVADSTFIIQHGHVWSLINPKPVIDSNYTKLGRFNATEGPFISKLSDLSMETKYYIRSYVITQKYNGEGDLVRQDTGYNQKIIDTITDVDNNIWRPRSVFPGPKRDGAIQFVVNDRWVYYGFGDYGFGATNDLWMYDYENDSWSEVTGSAPFPGEKRKGAFAFSIGNKGYIGCGTNDVDRFKDVWEWDHDRRTWTQMDDYPRPMFNGFGFAIDEYGYAGNGQYSFNNPGLSDQANNDLYRFDPSRAPGKNSQWFTRGNIGGPGSFARIKAAVFVLQGQAFVGTGITTQANGDTLFLKDLWKFNPDFESWQSETDFPNTPRADAFAFGVIDAGYIGGGYDESGTKLKNFFEYNPFERSWIRRADFVGEGRQGATCFGIGKYGYVVGGYNRVGTSIFRYNDVWQFVP